MAGSRSGREPDHGRDRDRDGAGSEARRLASQRERAAAQRALREGGVGAARAAARVLPHKLGLDVVQNQPAVGQNMQDHFGINYLFKANRPTLNDVFGSWPGRRCW